MLSLEGWDKSKEAENAKLIQMDINNLSKYIANEIRHSKDLVSVQWVSETPSVIPVYDNKRLENIIRKCLNEYIGQ